jgi:hypothetical protein
MLDYKNSLIVLDFLMGLRSSYVVLDTSCRVFRLPSVPILFFFWISAGADTGRFPHDTSRSLISSVHHPIVVGVVQDVIGMRGV